jgi:hypothetical protein
MAASENVRIASLLVAAAAVSFVLARGRGPGGSGSRAASPDDAAPAGAFLVASLDAAKARRESEIFVVPGRGIVAERWREKVTVLGIFPKTTEETVVVVPTKGTP